MNLAPLGCPIQNYVQTVVFFSFYTEGHSLCLGYLIKRWMMTIDTHKLSPTGLDQNK